MKTLLTKDSEGSYITRQELMDALKGIPMNTKIYLGTIRQENPTWGYKHSVDGYSGITEIVVDDAGNLVIGSGEEITPIPQVPQHVAPLMKYLIEDQDICEQGQRDIVNALKANPNDPPVAVFEKYWATIEEYAEDNKEEFLDLLPDNWKEALEKIVVRKFWEN